MTAPGTSSEPTPGGRTFHSRGRERVTDGHAAASTAPGYSDTTAEPALGLDRR